MGKERLRAGDPTVSLQGILGYNPLTGEYRYPHMLRRLAQLYLMHDRGISKVDIARHLGISKQAIYHYFRNQLWTGLDGNRRPTPEGEARREDGEDRVERAIEAISQARGFQLGRVTGSTEDNYLSYEVILPELMRTHQ